MNINKYFDRIKLMDNYIRRKATGTPDQFARKLGVSRSSLMEYLKLLKELNAPISYDSYRGSYYYLFPCELKLGFESKYLKNEEMIKINRKELKKFCEIVA